MAAALAAGMLRKGGGGGGGGGGGDGGGGGTKHTQALPRHQSRHLTGSLSVGSTKTLDMGRSSKNPNPLSSMGLSSQPVGAPGVDPEYVMQLVNDVRWFADVLLNLKDAFQCKGERGEELECRGSLWRGLSGSGKWNTIKDGIPEGKERKSNLDSYYP